MPRVSKKEENDDALSSERLFYRIGEVSRITGLKPHVLRYWESEFKAVKPHKGGSLQRLYRKKDLDLILKIKRLLHEEGFTIAGARKRLESGEDGPEASPEVPAEARPEQGAVPATDRLQKVKMELENILTLLNRE